ncbi:3-hydroxyacyl-CoA dehydrogenase NAD-binding domain-containing protein [Ignavigranum ruoffiae]|uniref:3-hydroxyacyl-CoA dehydrogenase family protein n=1 Tax=Ignavigranum ruoffiae TaxID=89093 RepID=UPI0020622EB4|nr:3-hydroxyacyl-CoA dehydrogenase NAD-binding domain-containing protein [Ignavigranum ruoffiae]UPQ85021.1 3-hydroxyacyl-CoA dehydrogenase NAD-binding domain-containing protein [Ignavigranum ruoffiae]
MSQIKTVGVVGAGSMGSGIANAFAMNGYQVILRDIKEEFLQGGLQRIEKFMEKSVQRGKLSQEDKEATLGRIQTTTELADFKAVDFVVEAVLEKMDLKQSVFKELEGIVRPEVVLATNTSSLSITEIASVLDNPSRFAGMHFFNPAQVMKLVEVIHGYETSEETAQTVRELAESIGKEVVTVKKDSPGFIVNRIMIPQFIEAIKVLEEGIASVEDIDKAMKYGLNHPMGAFELQDYAGVDIGYYVMEYFAKEFGESRWTPPTTLKNLVRAGRIGRKVGKGYYDYDKK